MWKIKIEFRDGTIKEFWAESSYSITGNLLYWNTERNVITHHQDDVKSIVETPEEERP